MDKDDIAELLNLIGALFSLDPMDARMRPVLEGLARRDPTDDTANAGSGLSDVLQRLGRPYDTADLHRCYLDLFVGPAPLEAPPWGSVYLDEERVTYGASTLRLRELLRREMISAVREDSGPEDHFGTLCWIGAWLSCQERLAALDELLGQHVLPWASLYLQEFRRAAQDKVAQGDETAAFYVAAADLAEMTLRTIAGTRSIQIARWQLHPSKPSA